MVVAKESECTDEGISRNSSSMMKGALSSPKKKHTRHMNRLKNMTLDSAMNIIHFQGRKGHCVARARSRWGIGVFLKDSQRLGMVLFSRRARKRKTASHSLTRSLLFWKSSLLTYCSTNTTQWASFAAPLHKNTKTGRLQLATKFVMQVSWEWSMTFSSFNNMTCRRAIRAKFITYAVRHSLLKKIQARFSWRISHAGSQSNT